MAAQAPRRRARGDGTLREIERGVWRLRAYIGRDPLTKKPIQASRTFRGNRTDALKELRRFCVEVGAGKYKATDATASMLFHDWLPTVERKGRRPTTVATYRIIIEKHLDPYFGHMKLRKITARDLDLYYERKQAEPKPLSARTLGLHHAILSAAFAQGVRWEWMDRNPAAAASPPGESREKGKTPEVEDVRKLIDAAQSPDEQAIVALAAITGARRGELAGLQWSDVDWQRGTITIQRQRVPVKGGNETGPLKHGDQRRVAIGDLGLEALRRYRAVIEDRARQLKSEPGPWLLSPECGDEPFRAQAVGYVISRLGKEAGVDVTAHALRRFAATQLVGLGTDVVTTASRLGHTPQILLDRYAGIRPGADVDAARQLEAKVLGVLPAGD